MKKITIYVEEDNIRELKHIAVEENTSMSEIIRMLVRQYLQNKE